MRSIATTFTILVLYSCVNKEPKKEINDVLDSLHHLASLADEKRYINLFSKNAIFFGTDISERWPKNEFKLYVKSRFDSGIGWTYKPINRNIFISNNERVAWFDEILFNEKYGEFRGTGVLIIENGEWKISQYNLLLPIPNDFLQKYANEIKEHYMK